MSSLRSVLAQSAAESDDEDLLLAALVGHRDEFVIDLRDGDRTKSYLRMAPRSVGDNDEGLPGSRAWFRAVRRSLDVATSLVALIVFAPMGLMVAMAISVGSRGPVLFRQERVGRNGEIFTCLKFRSMYTDADERLHDLLANDPGFREQWLRDHKAENDPRVTRMGRFLRKTSLDELPQLMNVLRGEMSIVGPRPVVPAETVRYGDAMPMVLSVDPGLTGLWQVSGRNTLPYPERVELDLEYVRTQSLGNDVSILARTIGCLISGHGAV